MNILIVGGLGYVGAHLAKALAREHNIHILDKAYNKKRDLCNYLSQLHPRRICHHSNQLGAYQTHAQIMQALHIDLMIDCTGSPGLFSNQAGDHQCHSYWFGQAIESKVKYVIYLSSAAVYGQTVYLPIDEAHATRPVSHYGEQKLADEALLNQLSQTHKIHGLSLRIFNCYGSDFPFAHQSQIGANLIDHLFNICQRSNPEVRIQRHPSPDGSLVRDFLFITDLMSAMSQAIDFLVSNPGHHLVNLGSGQGTSLLELVQQFEDLYGTTLAKIFDSTMPSDISQSIANIDLAKQLLNWKPRVGLNQGLDRLYSLISGAQ
jgi:UDP-glucose 4-epimerase